MIQTNQLHDLATQLPNKAIPDFYGELINNIAHDERSYGPTAFTMILSSFAVLEENNPRTLYLSVVEQAEEIHKEVVMIEGLDYFKGILEEFFNISSEEDALREKITQDISEEDLPF